MRSAICFHCTCWVEMFRGLRVTMASRTTECCHECGFQQDWKQLQFLPFMWDIVIKIISAATLNWVFINELPTFVTALGIKRYQNHIAWEIRPRPDTEKLCSCYLLYFIRNNFILNCAYLVHVYAPQLILPMLAYILLSVVLVVEISAASE